MAFANLREILNNKTSLDNPPQISPPLSLHSPSMNSPKTDLPLLSAALGNSFPPPSKMEVRKTQTSPPLSSGTNGSNKRKKSLDSMANYLLAKMSKTTPDDCASSDSNARRSSRKATVRSATPNQQLVQPVTNGINNGGQAGVLAGLLKVPSSPEITGSVSSPLLSSALSAPSIPSVPNSQKSLDQPGRPAIQALSVFLESRGMKPTGVASPLVNNNNNSDSKKERKITSPVIRELAPKLSRHNDAAYYPNIQCILCQEWVCSRNRYMHIESHLQYRPYKCSMCGYDNRKEIFIQLHVKKAHKGLAEIKYEPDPDLEQRAWILAEQCLQHTRQVLTQKEEKQEEPQAQIDVSILEPYGDVYSNVASIRPGATLYTTKTFRPKIFNNQRHEKTMLIEESRQRGLVPDFSEVANREERCHICNSHILRHHSVLEEHVRSHLPEPSYMCDIEGCSVEHNSKNFLSRHMKEVHKYRRQPTDLLFNKLDLADKYLQLCEQSFPSLYDSETMSRLRYRYFGGGADEKAVVVLPKNEVETKQFTKQRCAMCGDFVVSSLYRRLYEHALTHVVIRAYTCAVCSERALLKTDLLAHMDSAHQLNGANAEIYTISHYDEDFDRACCDRLLKCFPTTVLQRNLHEPIVQSASKLVQSSTDCIPVESADIHQQDSLGISAESLMITRKQEQMNVQSCVLCQKTTGGSYKDMYEHVKLHLPSKPYACKICTLSSTSIAEIQDHVTNVHPGCNCKDSVRNLYSEDVDKQCGLLLAICFTGTKLDPSQHDPVVDEILHSCYVCHCDEIPNKDLHEHIRQHIELPLFKCTECDYKDCIGQRMKMHSKKTHSIDVYPSAIRFGNSLDEKLQILQIECFGVNRI